MKGAASAAPFFFSAMARSFVDQLLIAADEAMYSAKSFHKQRPSAPDPAQPAELAAGDLASTAIN